MLDTGPKKGRQPRNGGRPGGDGKQNGGNDGAGKHTENIQPVIKGRGAERNEIPLCLWEKHRKAGVRHWFRDFPDCPDDERKRILSAREAEKARDGPSASTRSKSKEKGDGDQAAPKHITVRLMKRKSATSCSFNLCDEEASIKCV